MKDEGGRMKIKLPNGQSSSFILQPSSLAYAPAFYLDGKD
jgi:hypothetical protein